MAAIQQFTCDKPPWRCSQGDNKSQRGQRRIRAASNSISTVSALYSPSCQGLHSSPSRVRVEASAVRPAQLVETDTLPSCPSGFGAAEQEASVRVRGRGHNTTQTTDENRRASGWSQRQGGFAIYRLGRLMQVCGRSSELRCHTRGSTWREGQSHVMSNVDDTPNKRPLPDG